jgi:VWFA-related protein
MGSAAVTLVLMTALTHAQSAAPPPQAPVFRSSAELVLVNVLVRDRNGAVVRGLKATDFTVTEDDKPQPITSFDFEELDRIDAAVAPPDPATAPTPLRGLTAPRAAQPLASAPVLDMHGRRLMVLFFDLSSMQPEEITRSVSAAEDYVTRQWSPADMVAVVSFSTALKLEQDFTVDRELVLTAIHRFGGAGGQGFDVGAAGDPDGTPDDGTAFTADDTEFSIFNTDRRLDALQLLSDTLSSIDQKKSVVYFSSGMSQSGQDNQVELRRTIDRANRANVSIYAADMRGLQAIAAGGDASQASTRGVSLFSGAATKGQFDRLASTQDTLTNIAEDTGGRAFFDSNGFGEVFQRVVADTSAYYVLGYSSSNRASDGRFRRIKVRLRDTSFKLEYRSGYYAKRDFAHSGKDDREQQLQDQLLSDLSSTDLNAWVSTAYLRVSDTRFFVPISILVPGYQVPFSRSTDKNHATLDILAIVRDAQQRPVGKVRDTMRLGGEGVDDLKHKSVQYQTGMELAPGRYKLKVVVRENQDGAVGSYEADLVVPDLKSDAVKVSSIVLGTGFQAAGRGDDRNPLVRDGRELIPNPTHVVSSAQHLYFHYEVYDPVAAPAPEGAPAGKPSNDVRLLTSIAFFRGRTRAFETTAVETTTLNAADRKTAVFQFDVPGSSLPPGLYTCQVNVVDDVKGAFVFPRLQIYVRR